MKKTKYLIITFITILTIILIPNLVNADTTEYSYKDTDQGIEWGYRLDDSGNVIDLKCKTTSKTGSVTIPSKIDGKTVISLKGDNSFRDSDNYEGGAFEGCTGVTAVTIPNTVSNIGERAFYGCTGLKSITIPDSVTIIEDYAFTNCSGLASVTFSKNLTSIGDYAFQNCTGLKSITLPNTVTTLGSHCFYSCSGLNSVTLSTNLSILDEGVFGKCSGLTSIKLPESVTTVKGDSLSYGAFYSCSNLSKVLIPDSVVTIEPYAFANCDKLTIYGNDGQASKTFAEEQDINFDYIANWDKASSGTDVTAPTVSSIAIKYSSILKYWDSTSKFYKVPSGAEIVINVAFSETIKGTVPTLTIKFGEGDNIKLTKGTISDNTIVYIYTIQSTDEGTMSVVSFEGGKITDTAGNSATLSCPKLSVQYEGTDVVVYANGKASTVNSNNSSSTNNNSNNSTNSTSTSGSSNKGNTTTGSSSNNSSSSSSKSGSDNTTYTASKLPQTGTSYIIIGISAFAVAIGVVLYLKYRKMRDIV